MRYTPKHTVAKNSTAGRKVAGIALAGAATVGAGVASSSSASAAGTGSAWDRLAQCESGGNWSINTGNSFYGGIQFTQQTWVGYGGTAYAPYAHQASKAQQIAIAQKVLADVGPRAWPVCSVRAGLTKNNGGTSTAPAATTASRSTARSALPAAAPKKAAPAPKKAAVAPKRVTVAPKQTTVAPKQNTVAPKRVTTAPVQTPRVATTNAPTVKKTYLAVDGILGPRTARALQAWVGSYQDGIVGVNTKVMLQKKVGVYRDGIIGKDTVAALQDKLGIQRDGSWTLNARTVRALQAHLNNL